jgi:hypothetical protein
MIMEEEVTPMATQMPAAVIPLNNMVANFEQNDLDVPAFMRKRNEAM